MITRATHAKDVATGLLCSLVGLWVAPYFFVGASGLLFYFGNFSGASGWFWLYCWVFLLIGVIQVPLALLFCDRDTEPQTGSYGIGLAVRRGTLPEGSEWLDTPDERPPGGMYEPFVEKVYKALGWYACAYYWLAMRNTAHGFAWQFKRPTNAYLDLLGDGYISRARWVTEADQTNPPMLWRWQKTFGIIVFQTGWKVYASNAERTQLMAVPFVSVRRAKREKLLQCIICKN